MEERYRIGSKLQKNGPQQGETRCKKGFSDGQVNIWAKLYEKILKGSEEKEKLKPKNTSKWHTTEGDMIWKKSQRSDRQRNIKNICTKCWVKMLNGSQKIEE